MRRPIAIATSNTTAPAIVHHVLDERDPRLALEGIDGTGAGVEGLEGVGSAADSIAAGPFAPGCDPETCAVIVGCVSRRGVDRGGRSPPGTRVATS